MSDIIEETREHYADLVDAAGGTRSWARENFDQTINHARAQGAATFAAKHDIVRSAVSTWLTLALDVGHGRLLMGDLLALRDWIDGGCVGDMPLPKDGAR